MVAGRDLTSFSSAGQSVTSPARVGRPGRAGHIPGLHSCGNLLRHHFLCAEHGPEMSSASEESGGPVPCLQSPSIDMSPRTGRAHGPGGRAVERVGGLSVLLPRDAGSICSERLPPVLPWLFLPRRSLDTSVLVTCGGRGGGSHLCKMRVRPEAVVSSRLSPPETGPQ